MRRGFVSYISKSSNMGRKNLAVAQIPQIRDNKYHGLKPRLQGLLGVLCGFA
jgi:hypothetical protein